MTILDHVSLLIADLPVYLINGVLVVFYFLADALPAIFSLTAAGLIVLFMDQEVQQRAVFQPRKGLSSPVSQRQPHTAQTLTVIICLLWVCAQCGLGAPVPWIGAAMWVCGLFALLVAPAQRFNLLWFIKAGIAIYSLCVIGGRIYLSMTSRLSPEAWAALIGSSESANAVLSSTRGSATTIILWALWLVVPLGYFSLLVQQLFVNPMSLINPLSGAQEVLQKLRTGEQNGL